MLIRRDDARARGFTAFALGPAQTTVPKAPTPDDAPDIAADRQREPRSPESIDLAAEVTATAKQLATLEQALAEERAGHKAAIAAAFDEGLAQGRREADDLAAQRLAALREAAAAAAAACAAGLDDQASLAVRIARTGLARILGDGTARAGMVEEIVRAMFAELATTTVLKVRVSAADFPDGSAAEAAVAALAPAEVAILREADLPGGSCLFDLALGTVDASLGLQARTLDTELRRFEHAPGADA